jgi:hypothetical protein
MTLTAAQVPAVAVRLRVEMRVTDRLTRTVSAVAAEVARPDPGIQIPNERD